VQGSLTALAEFIAEAETVPRDSLEILIDFANSDKIPASLRISAAAAAAPYQHAKKAAVPGPQYLHTSITVPAFQSIEEAETFLHELSQREGRKELESQSVATISARVQAWISNKRADQELELKHIAQDIHTGPQTISIEGGMPSLPGTNITMPHQLNGNGHGLLTIDNASPTSDATPDPSPEPKPQVRFYRGQPIDPIKNPGPPE
jgi:hypothetical protein